MRCLIIDHEPLLAQILKTKLWERFPQIRIIDICADPLEGLAYLRTHADTAVVMVDTDMPRMHGLEVLKTINEEGLGAAAIMVSAHKDFDFVRSAWKMRALAYITKPVDVDELVSVLEGVVVRWAKNAAQEEDPYLIIPIAKGSLRIRPREILYIKSAGRKAHLVKLNGTHEIIYSSLGEMQKVLERQSFIRAGRFALLNETKIGVLFHKNHSVIMQHGSHSENVDLGRGGYGMLVKYLNSK